MVNILSKYNKFDYMSKLHIVPLVRLLGTMWKKNHEDGNAAHSDRILSGIDIV